MICIWKKSVLKVVEFCYPTLIPDLWNDGLGEANYYFFMGLFALQASANSNLNYVHYLKEDPCYKLYLRDCLKLSVTALKYNTTKRIGT
jgi:hypothetical protein